jgi:hypothetical protein
VPAGIPDDARNHQRLKRDWKGIERQYYAMPFNDRYIWGVTAGILRNLTNGSTPDDPPVFTEIALFLAPFVIYAIYLIATIGAADACVLAPKVLATLGICALILMIGSFVYLSHFSGSPPGSTYEPAHVDERGNFVPGQVTVSEPPLRSLKDAAWLREARLRAAPGARPERRRARVVGGAVRKRCSASRSMNSTLPPRASRRR